MQQELFRAPPTRESAATKARRYLAEGRLTVIEVSERKIFAFCRGSGEIYMLGYVNGAWFCECPARTICSHLEALRLVTTRAPRRAARAVGF